MCTFDKEERRLQAVLRDSGTKEEEIKEIYMIYVEKEKISAAYVRHILKKLILR